MTVKELETKLAELKASGKITDESRILSFNDEYGEFNDSYDIELVAEHPLCDLKCIREDIQYYKKERMKSFYREKKQLLKNLTTIWKDAIRIV